MKRSEGSKELHLQPDKLKSEPVSGREDEPEVSYPPDGVRCIYERVQIVENNLETFIFTSFICFYWRFGDVFILWNYFWMATIQEYICERGF